MTSVPSLLMLSLGLTYNQGGLEFNPVSIDLTAPSRAGQIGLASLDWLDLVWAIQFGPIWTIYFSGRVLVQESGGFLVSSMGRSSKCPIHDLDREICELSLRIQRNPKYPPNGIVPAKKQKSVMGQLYLSIQFWTEKNRDVLFGLDKS